MASYAILTITSLTRQWPEMWWEGKATGKPETIPRFLKTFLFVKYTSNLRWEKTQYTYKYQVILVLTSFSSSCTGLPTNTTILSLWLRPCLCFRASWGNTNKNKKFYPWLLSGACQLKNWREIYRLWKYNKRVKNKSQNTNGVNR